MDFKFATHRNLSFLDSFSETYGVPVLNNMVIIPDSLGKGFIKCIDMEDGTRMVLHHFTLLEDFRINRLPPEETNDHISIIFNSTEKLSDPNTDIIHTSNSEGSAIQISSTSLATESFFPANSEINFIAIGTWPAALKSMLNVDKTNHLVQHILEAKEQFFYHESLTPEFQRILKQVSAMTDQDQLSGLYYKIKIQELIYLLFGKLLKRESEKHSPINKSDIDRVYLLRSAIMKDLSIPPALDNLSKLISMSETKMKQLFKQTFGDSIYNYYQKLRMEEAAFLLKQAGYSVSETGYNLGFSNLSHFSKLFEKHYGITPKKYTAES